MSKQIFYVGIDVGASELWASIEGMKPRMFSHSAAGIKALYRWSNKRISGKIVHFCMESTGVYSLHVAHQLFESSAVEVSLINPSCISAYARMQLRRAKTDAVDAEVIRSYAETQHPQLWQPCSKVIRQLYSLVVHYDALQASLQQWRNRGHAHGYTPDVSPEVIKSRRAVERSIKQQLANIEQAIDQLCRSDAELAEQVLLLESIPGIARRSAVKLLAYGREHLTERTPRQLVAHAGLAPHHHISGTSVCRKPHLDKRGDHRLRKTLYMPALVGIVHNPILKKFYQRLCTKGKPKKVALIACMKKLLLISRSMLINKTTFKPDYLTLT